MSASNASKSFSLFGSWNDAPKERTRDILKEKRVLKESTDVEETKIKKPSSSETSKESKKEEPIEPKTSFWSGLATTVLGIGGEEEHKKGDKASMDALIASARSFTSATQGPTSTTKPEISLEEIARHWNPIEVQLQRAFSNLPLDKIDPVSFMFYLETEDSKKNPSWKRRKHRFCPGFDLEMIHSLHEYLFLAELAYVDEVDHVKDGIQNFQQDGETGAYELIYCTVEGEPNKPAHYLAMKKAAHEVSTSFWSSLDESYLELLMVVRGTKEVADVFSDALLEASSFRDGFAHEGIAKSGAWLVESHLPLLNHLLEESGHSKIKLTLVGHSLGAGAAAIACIEFNDHANIDATCIAFEPPATVDKATSEAWKDKITTIVADADVVPRMSGATIANLIIRILEHDWKHRAIEDVTSLLDFLALKIPIFTNERKAKTIEFIQKQLDENVVVLRDLERRSLQLFPPGKCIHLYRDGIGVSCVEVSCDFFDEIDVNLTMVDDHYTIQAAKALALSKAKVLVVCPVVTDDNVDSWTNWTASEGRKWVDEALMVLKTDKNFYGLIVEDYTTLDYIYGGNGPVPRKPGRVYLPSWQAYPIVPSWPPYNFGYIANLTYTSAHLEMMEKGTIIITNPYLNPDPQDPEAMEIAESKADWLSKRSHPDEEPMEPASDLYFPIRDNVASVETNSDNFSPAAAFAVTFYWRDMIRDFLPESAFGILIV